MAEGCLLASIALYLVFFVQAPVQAFLLFADANNGRIMKFSPQDSESLISLPLENSISRPVALAYDIVEDRVYWTDVIRNSISRAFLNGSSQEVIHDSKLQTPEGLAVDIIGRNIYWTDTGTNKLEVSKMNGSLRTAIVTSGLDEPRDIILDANMGVMYWTDWGSFPKIEKAEMTGQQRSAIVTTGLRWPNGLTLDREKNRLFWVDAYLDTLEYLDLSQNNRVTLISSKPSLAVPFGLTILGDNLYWTDWKWSAVFGADKETGGNITRFPLTGIGKPMDIHGYNQSEYSLPQGISICQFNNGGCSHICLLSPAGGECACPVNFILARDEKTCEHQIPRKFLLFADASQAEILILSLNDSNAKAQPVSMELDIRRPVALDFDLTENRIYWTDVTLNTISRVFVNGSSPEVLVSENIYSPEGLAFDPLGGNIYWTDTGTNKIEVSRKDGTMRKTLISSNLDEPRDIILDLTDGMMYWCDWGEDHKIEVANMDGRSRSILVKRGLQWPNGLTLDDTNRRLYWVDAGFQTLEYYDLKDHTITTLMKSSKILPSPFGLTLFENYLYWTDWALDAVYQAEKDTFSNLKIVLGGLSAPVDIHAYDTNKSLPDHPCSSSHGGCSHLCLVRPDGYRCSCPDHLPSGEVCNSTVVILPSSSPSTSPSQTPSSSSPAECRPNICKNGGTCVVPGYFCVCTRYYVWNQCAVYVGSSAVEIKITFSQEKQWNEYNFRVAIAKACTDFFCKSGECKSASGREKRSESAKVIQESDVRILGLLTNGEAIWKIEFAVLFPSVDGKAPQPFKPEELVQMVDENKKFLGKAVGGLIERITIGKQPDQPKGGAKSTQDDKGTSAGLIAAGVICLVIVLVLVAAFVIYRMRRIRSRRHDVRTADDIHMENNRVTNNNSHTNPTFGQDPMYDLFSPAKGASVAEKVKQVNDEDGSKVRSNPAYDVGNNGDHGIEDSELQYASLENQKESNLPQHAATDDENYEQITHENQLHA